MTAMTELPPVRREVIVGADPDLAFRVFTEQIASWWPVEGHSVHGAGSSVAFRNGKIIETHPDQPDSVWGTVIIWDPPDSVEFTWHPGGTADRAGRVRVSFTRLGPARTLVQLEHSGWSVYADPEAARNEYQNGWPRVLGEYQDAVHTDNSTWAALLHRAKDGVDNVFTDPRFADHVAFLDQLRERGYLIAAGPLTDESGAGMTIVRVPGHDQLDQIARLATTEDGSVTGGLFWVQVRPWRVINLP